MIRLQWSDCNEGESESDDDDDDDDSYCKDDRC